MAGFLTGKLPPPGEIVSSSIVAIHACTCTVSKGLKKVSKKESTGIQLHDGSPFGSITPGSQLHVGTVVSNSAYTVVCPDPTNRNWLPTTWTMDSLLEINNTDDVIFIVLTYADEQHPTITSYTDTD
jgi:hypothetical protein